MKAGWKIVKLGDVAEMTSGLWKGETGELVEAKVYRATNFFGNGELSVENLVTIPVEAKKLTKRTLEQGDILLEKSGGGPNQPVGRVGLFRKSDPLHSFSNFTSRIRVIKSSDLDQAFLHKYLHWVHLRGGTAGMQNNSTNIRNLDLDKYRSIEIPLPPLAEQKRIVALLDKAFAGIDEAMAKAEVGLANSHALFVQHLQFIFGPNPNWSKGLLGDVCEFENGDRGPSYPNRNEYVKAGIPWINAGHIQSDGKLSRTEMNYITLDKFQKLRSGKIKPGDLVYCLRGAVGKTAIVEPLVEGAIASSLVIIRPSSKIDPLFLYFYLISPIGHGISKKFENGAAQPNLGAKNLAKYPISYPTIPEQKKISGNLASFRDDTLRLAAHSEQKLVMLKQLKESLLQKAFDGGLVQ